MSSVTISLIVLTCIFGGALLHTILPQHHLSPNSKDIAPFNATVVSSLFVSALLVSGAIFLILVGQ